MSETVDSILQKSDIFTPINKIAENTEPINLVNWDLSWWSFHIAIFSLIAGIIAAIYSYRGYKFQKISAERLEKLIPGQISFFEVICCLMNNIIDIESIFFGKKSYKEYSTKLLLSFSKLPEDLIELEKYEKNIKCYEEAFELKIAWRNYNILIENLIESLEQSNIEQVLTYANHIISVSKSYIVLVQRFENTLVSNAYLSSYTSTNKRIAYFILDRFFEYLNDYGYMNIETTRSNLKSDLSDNYIFSPFFPNLIDVDNYIKSNHTSRLSIFFDNKSDNKCDIVSILNDIKTGKYNELSNALKLPPNVTLSSLDIHYFKTAYYNFIEPIIIGFKRYEYSTFSHTE